MNGDAPAQPLSLLVVQRRNDEIRITSVHTDHGDAHAAAEAIAKEYALNPVGTTEPMQVAVYRRIATYEAEVRVTMKRDGE